MILVQSLLYRVPVVTPSLLESCCMTTIPVLTGLRWNVYMEVIGMSEEFHNVKVLNNKTVTTS